MLTMSLLSEFKSQLGALAGLQLQFDEPLAHHTSFRIGGPADVLCTVTTRGSLPVLLHLAAQYQVPVFLLGRGTNLLVRDGGIRGLVLKLAGELATIRVEGTRLWAGGGAVLAEAAWIACEHELSGLEWAVGIPGSVGGAIIMNAGTNEGEMAQLVEHVATITLDGTPRHLLPADLEFSYRTSALRGRQEIVVEVCLALQRGNQETSRQCMECTLQARRAAQPLDWPSAGSMFKRPPGDYAGRLIEAVGAKGLRIGDAQVAPQHANFVVNLGQATARDVLELMAQIQKLVWARFAIKLEPEVQVVGEKTEETTPEDTYVSCQ